VFFPEKIIKISARDKVLEIGPGGSPFLRSDVFLELVYDDDKQYFLQSGGTPRLSTSKPLFYYDGDVFPFEDNQFDYIICSHVIEHVPNLEQFLSEVFRVGNKGYMEYPTVYYEYLYNFSVHKNFLKMVNGQLLYLRKSETHIDEFLSIQKFFLESLEKGHHKLIEDLKDYMFEGFEWIEPFQVFKAKNISELTDRTTSLPPRKEEKQRFFQSIQQYLAKVVGR
jgi:ubiquinone/menaquinone biosynthesis C-methylase UbiE